MLSVMERRRAAMNDKCTLEHIEFEMLVEHPNRIQEEALEF